MEMSWFTKNLALKIIALVFAVIIWSYASGEGMAKLTLRVPLEVQVQNEKMTITQGANKMLRVVFQAPKNDLALLSEEDVKAIRVIKGRVNTGEYSFQISKGDFRLPSENISIQEIYPKVLRVTLDDVVSRKLKVKPVIQGEPAIGFSFTDSDVLVDPNTVLVTGPKSKIEKMDSIKTTLIDIVGRMQSFKKKVKLDLPSGFSESVNTNGVEVIVPLVAQFSSKTYENIPVKVLGIPEKTFSVFLDPSIVTLTLKGPLRILEELKDEDLMAYVEITGRKKGKYNLSLQLNVPKDLSLKDEQPKIRVILEEIKR